MSIKAVVFDFNGTLFWDTAYHSTAFDVFVSRYLNGSEKGLRSRPLTDEDKRNRIMGQPNDRAMEFIFGRSLTPNEVSELGEEKEIIYRELCRGKVTFAPGAESFFDWLKRANIPFTIASSADKGNIDFYYEQMNLGKWFPRDKIVYNDGSFSGKPAPDIFLLAARKLNVKPHEMAVFEDSASGILAAEQAKVAQIVIVNSSPNDAVFAPGSGSRHRVITDFREAVEVLNWGDRLI